MEYKLLDRINTPEDIKGFSLPELKELCSELRDYIVHVCAQNPGHLASSLGAVELIVGIHYVFDTPMDKLVFDVGHQAYAHKILTGRKEEFRTMRTQGGISGFPKMSESRYDSFGVGHSSTSISAALGFAEAARIKGLEEKAIALIGDGALTGGMAFEAMNNAGASKADILIVLNDNNHSIDAAHGGLHEHLLRITTSESYNKLKNQVWDRMGERKARNAVQRWIRSMKSWLVKKMGGDVFEALGIRYFGPIDGNDIEQVVTVLKRIKEFKEPRVLHAITKKGFGYAPAEADPTVWHAPGKFDPLTGDRYPSPHPADRYQDVFGQVLCELAAKDSRVVGITPAMASGSSMTKFGELFPERFFDVGIEEEHAVTFSAGLAAAGLKPFCNIYSSFSQRAYDQIIHDVALQKLPVVLCFDRAGLVGEDGATHNGAFDIAAYRNIPNCIVSAPCDELELKNLMLTALEHNEGPFIIRYPRGMAESVEWRDVEAVQLEIGKSSCVREGKQIAIVACGPSVHNALKAAEQLSAKGIEAAVYNFRYIKPLDTAALDEIASKFKHILTIEDGSLSGGLYGAVCEYFGANTRISVHGIGIPDEFITHARQSAQREYCHLDPDGIATYISDIFA